MNIPYETFKNPVCKGDFGLGTACGHCEKCEYVQKQEAVATATETNLDNIAANYGMERMETESDSDLRERIIEYLTSRSYK